MGNDTVNDIMGLVELGQYAAAVTAIVGVILGAWWLTRRVVYIVDAVNQLLPDSGETVADRIRRIEEQQKSLSERVEDIYRIYVRPSASETKLRNGYNAPDNGTDG